MKVVGLFKSSSFQVSKTIAEVTPPPRLYARARAAAPASVPPARWRGPRSTSGLGGCVEDKRRSPARATRKETSQRSEPYEGEMVISTHLCIEKLVHVQF